MMNSINSVCWDITSKCNDKCQFCFRDSNSIDLSLDDNFLILNKFIDYGIEKITFTGGEACLYNGLWELIQHAKYHKIYTNLVTNALSVNDAFYSNMEKYLDCITLSLDGADPLIQKKMTRNINHFDNVLNILSRINGNNIKIDKKINTLVTKVNFHNILDILPIIYKNKINVWKLFQFIAPRYCSASNKNYFSISDSNFAKLKNEIILNNTEMVKIIFQATQDLKTSYFVVSSNGNVRYDGNNDDTYIGNVLTDDINNIFKNINFNFSSYMERKLLLKTNVA